MRHSTMPWVMSGQKTNSISIFYIRDIFCSKLWIRAKTPDRSLKILRLIFETTKKTERINKLINSFKAKYRKPQINLKNYRRNWVQGKCRNGILHSLSVISLRQMNLNLSARNYAFKIFFDAGTDIINDTSEKHLHPIWTLNKRALFKTSKRLDACAQLSDSWPFANIFSDRQGHRGKDDIGYLSPQNFNFCGFSFTNLGTHLADPRSLSRNITTAIPQQEILIPQLSLMPGPFSWTNKLWQKNLLASEKQEFIRDYAEEKYIVHNLTAHFSEELQKTALELN